MQSVSEALTEGDLPPTDASDPSAATCVSISSYQKASPDTSPINSGSNITLFWSIITSQVSTLPCLNPCLHWFVKPFELWTWETREEVISTQATGSCGPGNPSAITEIVSTTLVLFRGSHSIFPLVLKEEKEIQSSTSSTTLTVVSSFFRPWEEAQSNAHRMEGSELGGFEVGSDAPLTRDGSCDRQEGSLTLWAAQNPLSVRCLR